ncbi:UNVERIFIED_CONTAM: hypothetical protein K2H54_029000 [Gekko kuhli]
MKQNADQLNALHALGERCTPLEENVLLKEISFPNIQESNLRVSSPPVPLGLNYSDREWCDMVVAQEQAKDLNGQASVLLAKDHQIEALKKERRELQAKLNTLKEMCSPAKVQDVRGKGKSLDEDRCVSLLFDGPGGTSCEVPAAASDIQKLALLTLWNTTTTSAEITWSPSNDSHTHLVHLNEKEYDVTEAGIYCYTFQNLCPSTKYSVKVEPLVPQEALVSLGGGMLQQKAREMVFTTPSEGPPHVPTDVQEQAGSSEDILVISWLPETIHPSGSSNGVKVTGYMLFISTERKKFYFVYGGPVISALVIVIGVDLFSVGYGERLEAQKESEE